MRTIAHIPSLRASELGESVSARLRSVYPEGARYNERTQDWWYDIVLPTDDERYREIVDQLQGSGHQPWIDTSRKRATNEYRMWLEREYDAREIDAASHLVPKPNTYIEGLWRDASGHIMLDHTRLDVNAHIAKTNPYWVVVSPNAKTLIEGARRSLHHVAFRRTVIADTNLHPGTPLSWSEFGEPWWELTSDFILPPLSDTCNVTDGKGKRLPRGGSCDNGCFVRDGLYTDPEFHYRRTDVELLEPFDAALTFEQFGNKLKPDHRTLVVSQALYRACKPFASAVNWIPVRVDET